MSLEPTDLLVVNRGGKDYKITVQDIYNYVNQYPWRDHEGGIFHVIITNPTAINLTHSSVVHIIDLADGQEVDVIGHAGEFIVLTNPDSKQAFASSSGNWTFGNLTDTSKVTSMDGIFAECKLFNSDLSMFDTSNVLNMFNVFNNAIAFNQDISNWDVSKVTGTTQIFRYARTFNQDISNWDVSNMRFAEAMFNGARAFNQDLSKWCVSKIRNEPDEFATGTVAWALPKPVWGTCP